MVYLKEMIDSLQNKIFVPILQAEYYVKFIWKKITILIIMQAIFSLTN